MVVISTQFMTKLSQCFPQVVFVFWSENVFWSETATCSWALNNFAIWSLIFMANNDQLESTRTIVRGYGCAYMNGSSKNMSSSKRPFGRRLTTSARPQLIQTMRGGKIYGVREKNMCLWRGGLMSRSGPNQREQYAAM
ncbi:unnamed protein product [Ectocarpus sp. 4 AP-2014]